MRGKDFQNLKEQERQDPSVENLALEGHLQEKAEQPHRVTGIHFLFCFVLLYFILFCVILFSLFIGY